MGFSMLVYFLIKSLLRLKYELVIDNLDLWLRVLIDNREYVLSAILGWRTTNCIVHLPYKSVGVVHRQWNAI